MHTVMYSVHRAHDRVTPERLNFSGFTYRYGQLSDRILVALFTLKCRLSRESNEAAFWIVTLL